jgi:hypothetical protein
MIRQVYGADIEVGEEIGPLVKHPDTEQVRRFLTAWSPARSDRGMSRFTDAESAGRDGLAGPILPGNMSQAFLAQLVTDWAGPLGRLLSLDVNFRRPVRHGEELKCIGLVTDKRDEGEETIVHLDLFIEDPRGDRPVQGVAEVVLPAHGP